MRGLKLVTMYAKVNNIDVASFTDAWIETIRGKGKEGEPESHLLQMRGLKQIYQSQVNGDFGSHLLQMRGLKLTFKKKQTPAPGRIFYRCVD